MNMKQKYRLFMVFACIYPSSLNNSILALPLIFIFNFLETIGHRSFFHAYTICPLPEFCYYSI
uniref:Uncharacterized protein n=1 Tax=Anguilla anguilla TaxID=7936 RepID=A0A0E9P7Z3_ANGAN